MSAGAGPAAAAEFPRYAAQYARAAHALRREFPPHIQLALLDVLDELAQDPRRYPQRTRSISRDGKTFLYTHPSPSLEITYEVDEEKSTIYFLHFAAPMLQSGKHLFISYSHKDEVWLQEIRTWLTPLERRQLIKIWADSDIEAGKSWEQALAKSLSAAKAALLLISDDFLKSEFIATRELPPLLDAARSDGVLILWLKVRPVDKMDSEISQYQALYDPDVALADLAPAQREEALRQVLERVRKAVEA